MDHQEARQIVRTVLAADLACDERAFLDEGVTVTVAEERPGRRRFPRRSGTGFAIATMGAGVVVSCHPDRVDWLRATLGPLARDAIFSAETIACLSHYVEPDELVMSGPDLKFVCTSADLRPQEAALSAEGSLVEGDSVVRLYRHPGFRHALHYRVDPKRPDVLAAVATRNGEIVGIAGASADCDAMWQIGVDVVAPARGQRLGRALVSCLAAAILARGRLPYYSTTVANLASRNLAIGVGFWPAWIEMWTYAR